MTLTTETLNLWRNNAEITIGETAKDDPEHNAAEAILALTAELLANREAQPVQFTDGMALDFHRALTDGDIGKDDLEEIKVGLRAALCNVTAPPPPAKARPAAWEMRYWNSGYNIWGEWERITAEQYTEMSAEHAADNDYEFRVLYDAPPAPAVPPEATPENIENLLADITLFFTAGSLSHGGSVMFAEVWNACRAAMLKGEKS